MSRVQGAPLNQEWKARLLLTARQAPEFFETPDAILEGPHSSAIRTALTDLGLSGVFCIQGVPTVLILSVATYNRDAVLDLHGALWNQGLASVLLVLTGDTARVFSLARVPLADQNEEFERRCLVETLDSVADALALKNLLFSAESGRLWIENSDYFRPKERIDTVLLENLISSYQALCKGRLSSDAAQALLIQTMFIAYLEDRGIVNADYFQAALKRKTPTFSSLLETGDSSLLERLFTRLRKDFNGDLFVAPCSFEPSKAAPRIATSHLEILLRFRTGQEEMARGGQLRFWGYNFKYIPVELVSAVYDRFLGEKDNERKEQGAYYTPMFLTDTVISQLWDTLALEQKDKGKFLDPACGSGIFLVRVFQRLCDYRRQQQARQSQNLRWDTLLNILSRLHGSDINGSAVRVAVFSLYIALLEEVSPPDIRHLIERGRILPPLWGENLSCTDFFTVEADNCKVDVVIGNPPWASRKGNQRPSIAWCKEHELPMPEGEDAWAFAWKALEHLKPNGLVAFLLPAMSFLHNLAPSSAAARRLLMQKSRILRIVNFSDLRFQLFDGALRSTALVVFTSNSSPDNRYRIDYWTPRADINLKIRRFITLTPEDKRFIDSRSAQDNPLEFKQQLWMRRPDAKLFNYLSGFPKLASKIRVYGEAQHDKALLKQGWIIGYGFQPAGTRSAPSKSQYVGKLPYLPIEKFIPLALSTRDLTTWNTSKVFRRGFEDSFSGAKILIPRGVGTAAGRLRAAYTEEALTFRHIIQAISVPHGGEIEAKLLTALLNSRVLVWYAFHGTASFGSERPEVQQRDLLGLPFPLPTDLPDEKSAREIAHELVGIVDKALKDVRRSFSLDNADESYLRDIDALTYKYFGLSADEILLIEDAVEQLIPAIQPNAGTYPAIWKPATSSDRHAYIEVLLRSLKKWFEEGTTIDVQMEACNADLVILRLTLDGTSGKNTYVERKNMTISDSLGRLSQQLHQPLPGNFQLLPDFRAFVGKNLYLVKPIQKRFWLRSSALVDADAIALDLQSTVKQRARVTI